MSEHIRPLATNAQRAPMHLPITTTGSTEHNPALPIGPGAARIDATASGLTAEQVIVEEGRLVDGAFDKGRVPQDGVRGDRS